MIRADKVWFCEKCIHRRNFIIKDELIATQIYGLCGNCDNPNKVTLTHKLYLIEIDTEEYEL